MAGGTFKMSQPKVRPGTYVNVKMEDRRQLQVQLEVLELFL